MPHQTHCDENKNSRHYQMWPKSHWNYGFIVRRTVKIFINMTAFARLHRRHRRRIYIGIRINHPSSLFPIKVIKLRETCTSWHHQCVRTLLSSYNAIPNCSLVSNQRAHSSNQWCIMSGGQLSRWHTKKMATVDIPDSHFSLVRTFFPELCLRMTWAMQLSNEHATKIVRSNLKSGQKFKNVQHLGTIYIWRGNRDELISF